MFKIQQKPNPVASVRISSPSNIAGQIFFTTDYTIFKELLGNRQIDENHVKKLVRSMKQEYLEIPIYVNEKMEVIDGQHRIAACKELGLPVYYTIVRGYSLEQTQRQNALSKSWTHQDILNSYCNRGLVEYVKIKEFIKEFNLSLGQSLCLLSLNTGYFPLFKSGEFIVKDLDKSRKIAKQIIKLSKIVPIHDLVVFRSFFALLLKVEEFDPNLFIDKMKNQGQMFKKQRDVKLQIELIEEIYNYRNRNKINLRIIK